MQVSAKYEIVSWREAEAFPADDALRCQRVVVHKRFAGGLEADGVATVLITSADLELPVLSVGTPRSGGYVAQDHITGRLDGRVGSFVIHHGGHQRGDAPELFGVIVPGSGTDDLKGISGSVRFPHDPDRPGLMIIDYQLPG